MVYFSVFFDCNDENDVVRCSVYNVSGEVGNFVFYVIGIV